MDHMRKAEQVSRGADDVERVQGIAEAARCLALLEKDYGQAESWLLEARALAKRLSIEDFAVSDGTGLLATHRGRYAEAREQLSMARELARRAGDRLREFQALEHLLAVALCEDDSDQCRSIVDELCTLAERLPEGSESPFARAAKALVAFILQEGSVDDLDAGLDQLRQADAKQRLTFVLLSAAHVEIERRLFERAALHALEALEYTEILDRGTDRVCATALAGLSALGRGQPEVAQEMARRLDGESLRTVAARSLSRVAALFEALGLAPLADPSALADSVVDAAFD
jgi:hypothetical protein